MTWNRSNDFCVCVCRGKHQGALRTFLALFKRLGPKKSFQARARFIKFFRTLNRPSLRVLSHPFHEKIISIQKPVQTQFYTSGTHTHKNRSVVETGEFKSFFDSFNWKAFDSRFDVDVRYFFDLHHFQFLFAAFRVSIYKFVS